GPTAPRTAWSGVVQNDALFHVAAMASRVTSKSFDSAPRWREQPPRFQRNQRVYGERFVITDGEPATVPADCFKSETQGPGGFHRFQEIRADRFTLSTAALYDLYTRYGQSVDKKAALHRPRNYPQVPPQAVGPVYRGFQP
ncbi:hypothetical protein BZX17_24540, partial [Salmonella enterica subsp. enterica]|nr:hypothetical protein [Salmonella enterica subsp. enterica serovar Enteritidis]